MFDFLDKILNRDPMDRAKKHVDRAIEEWEQNYPDYASTEYEKAANLFLDADEIDFAIKYFREAAYCSLEMDNHKRVGNLKRTAARVLVRDMRYDEAAVLYSETSDHFNRAGEAKDSGRTVSMAVLSRLLSRNFDAAVNVLRKAEKRITPKLASNLSSFQLARLCVSVLFEGETADKNDFSSLLKRSSLSKEEKEAVRSLSSSFKFASDTDLTIEWAGAPQREVRAKKELEFELCYTCPVAVRVTDYSFSLSNSLRLSNEPEIERLPSKQESWLLRVKPTLSGDGSIGPVRMTLEGEDVLVHKRSNQVSFRIAPAPPDLQIDIRPREISCGLDEEVVFDITLNNQGSGPANDISLVFETSPGVKVSVGGESKSINFVGVGEQMRFQLYLRGVVEGTQKASVIARDSDGEALASEELQVFVE
jgi:tetratricopeptide (TPR) repeat protein